MSRKTLVNTAIGMAVALVALVAFESEANAFFGRFRNRCCTPCYTSCCYTSCCHTSCCGHSHDCGCSHDYGCADCGCSHDSGCADCGCADCGCGDYAGPAHGPEGCADCAKGGDVVIESPADAEPTPAAPEAPAPEGDTGA